MQLHVSRAVSVRKLRAGRFGGEKSLAAVRVADVDVCGVAAALATG